MNRLLYIILAVGAVALAAQVCDAIGSHEAIQARARMRINRPDEALAVAGRAIAVYPWQADATFTRLVAQERMGRWKEMLAARDVVAWHPYSAAVLALVGEAHAQRGESRAAAETLWQSFWRAPRPRDNPAQLWRIAMVCGAQAWGPADPRTRAAARRTLDLLAGDPNLRPEDRVQAEREARAILK